MCSSDLSMEPVAFCEVEAHRASNTRLLPLIYELLDENGVERCEIACVVVGRGPGSFTGVRIAMACAKGISQARGTALVGVSSLDAVAWGAWLAGVRGSLAVVADAMCREVYPVRFRLGEGGIKRLEADRVLAATVAAEELASGASAGLQLAGDAHYCRHGRDHLHRHPDGDVRALPACPQTTDRKSVV